jgi:hypothetical protein
MLASIRREGLLEDGPWAYLPRIESHHASSGEPNPREFVPWRSENSVSVTLETKLTTRRGGAKCRSVPWPE